MYKYVPKNQVKPYKSYCQGILNQLCYHLRETYHMQVSSLLIGSGAGNLVTQNGNGVFDLDYNLIFAHIPEPYASKPGSLKDLIRRELDCLLKDTFSYGQDSTASITYLVHSMHGNAVAFSFDVALIKKKGRSTCRLIHDKTHSIFMWNQIPNTKKITAKADAIRKAGKWNDLRKTYLNRKNMYLKRQDCDHPSYVVYIEAVNLIYRQLASSSDVS